MHKSKEMYAMNITWFLFYLLPVTVLFILVKIFDFKVTFGYASTYILLAQFISVQIDVIYVFHGLQYLVKHEATAWGITHFIIFFYSI